MDDFNVEMSDKAMEDFCSLNNLENFIKKTTCYKNHENPTCIDLILANRPATSNIVMYLRLESLERLERLELPHNLKWVFKQSYQKL